MRHLVSATAAFFIYGLLLGGCAIYGTRPSGVGLERMKLSEHFNLETSEFQNANPKFELTFNPFGLLKEMLFGGQTRSPRRPLPEVKPDLPSFIAESNDLKFIWLGHSTFLVRVESKTILIDPVLGPYASPVPVVGKRFQPSLLTPNEFPPIDVVVISHDHYDHLEMSTIKHFVDSSTNFVVPLGVGSHLAGWGISPDRIQELDWWQEVSVSGLKFVCTPAQHFSGRTGVKNNTTLWAGWVVSGERKKIFYSGDSGYSEHYKEIGDRLGPFDVTFIESGQYNNNWIAVHNLPEQAVQAHLDLKATVMVPVHWGAYELAFHDWFEPVERVVSEAAQRGITIITARLGEMVDLSQARPTDRWWEEHRGLEQEGTPH